MKRSNAIKTLIIMIGTLLWMACGGGGETKQSKFAPPSSDEKAKEEAKEVTFEEAVANWQEQKGIGPVDEVELGELDQQLADEGKQLFQAKCSACHQIGNEKVGPDPAGVLERRSPEWVMNMILNPMEMARKDPIGLGLLKQYNTIMADQGLEKEQARKILEYFRTI